MLFFKIPLLKIQTFFILFLIYSNFNNVWASNFITRGHYVIDLGQKVEWLTCAVGMIWQNEVCIGSPVKLKFNQIETAINQANQQLGGNWRLPNRKELEIQCVPVKKKPIPKKYPT